MGRGMACLQLVLQQVFLVRDFAVEAEEALFIRGEFLYVLD
jgi:hypothetical protein